MIRSQTLKMATGAILASLLAACGGNASGGSEAATGPEPAIIKDRQDNFETIGDAFKAIRSQLEGSNPDLAVIADAATDMNAAALKIEGYFPEGTSVAEGYDTEALPTIWEKPEDFAKAHSMLVDASAQMITVAQSGDAAAVAAQVGNVGKTCKNCHDTFRLDDKK